MDPKEFDTNRKSDFGQFPAARESDVLSELVRDIENERLGLDGVVRDYVASVHDDLRRDRATALAKSIAERGAAVDLGRLIEVLYFAGRQGLLRKHQLKFPAYDIQEQFFIGSGVPQGPRLEPPPEPSGPPVTVFGRQIDFPIGIPASVLTNNFEWVQYFFRLGYSVLTTRTVRSEFRDANPKPNWVFVPEMSTALSVEQPFPEIVADRLDWVDAGSSDVTTCNSFGVPSLAAEVWKQDLSRSLRHVEDGQLLIVSVMGDVDASSYESHELALQGLAEDFARTALLAIECGAEFIELNLSCPNSLATGTEDGVKPPLCYDVDRTVAVIEHVRNAIGLKPKLIAKLSYMERDVLQQLLERCGMLVDGVAGINTIQTAVVDRAGDPTFGQRRLAGVSGVAVRNFGLDFVRSLVSIRLALDLDFEILGMGGVTDAASFEAMIGAGAAVAMSASGAFANPFLASECIEAFDPIRDRKLNLLEIPSVRQEIVARVGSILADGVVAPPSEVAVRMALPGDVARDVLDELADTGELERTDSGMLRLPVG